MRDKVKGKIVLVGRHTVVPVNLSRRPSGAPTIKCARSTIPSNPNAGQFGRGRGAATRGPTRRRR